jgi:hypothetical protein
LISAKLDKQDEERSSFGFPNFSWLFQSPWIWGEVRKCEEETGEELRGVYRKRNMLNMVFWFTHLGELRTSSVQFLYPDSPIITQFKSNFSSHWPMAHYKPSESLYPLCFFFLVWMDFGSLSSPMDECMSDPTPI